MSPTLSFACVLIASSLADPTIHFREDFADDTWSERWITSQHKSDFGKFELAKGQFAPEGSQGLKTTEDAHFYGISSQIENPITTKDKTLVLQFSVAHDQKIDCGGGYLKLFPKTLEQSDMHGESEYSIMFGPDICGPSNKKVHVIFNYKGKNLLLKKEIRPKDDELTHLYTLIVRPTNEYEVRIDNKKEQAGKLVEDWDFLEPKQIEDPEASQPEDWDDTISIDDPEAVKPEDWDQPEQISDPDSTKPDDWDDEEDGEWEAPMIPNPDYKGEWYPPQIDNPNYMGEWEHPMIDNPAYVEDNELYLQTDIGFVGIDIWQVKSGTIFDNILITDDEDFARQLAKETFEPLAEEEKKLKDEKDEVDRKKREEERKKREAEEAKEEAEEDDEEEDEESAFEEDAEVEEAGDPEEEAEAGNIDVKDEL